MPKPSDALHQTAAVVPMEILTPQQLAERLLVKPSWIYEQTRNRSGVRNPDPLPHIKMGLYLRFDWRDVLAWLERRRIKQLTAKLVSTARYTFFSGPSCKAS